MGKTKKTRAKPTAKKSVSFQSQASANDDSFVQNQLLLCEWQDKLEMSLFLFCQKFCPETVEKRKWTCYQAAELPALTDEIIRYCQDHKTAFASTGVTPEERDDFLLDLQASRVIRNAAVHREAILDDTLERLGDCAYRIISMVKRVVNCDHDSEIGKIQRWMAAQGWPTNNLSSTSAFLLRRRVDSGLQQVAQSILIKNAEKELNRKRNEEEQKVAAECRKQRQATHEDNQATAQLKREEQHMRNEEERSLAVECRKQRQVMQENIQTTAQLKREEKQMRNHQQREQALQRRAECRRRHQDQESLRVCKAAKSELRTENDKAKVKESADDIVLPQRTDSESSPLFAIWDWMC